MESLKFGKYKGVPLSEVPVYYFEWLYRKEIIYGLNSETKKEIFKILGIEDRSSEALFSCSFVYNEKYKDLIIEHLPIIESAFTTIEFLRRTYLDDIHFDDFQKLPKDLAIEYREECVFNPCMIYSQEVDEKLEVVRKLFPSFEQEFLDLEEMVNRSNYIYIAEDNRGIFKIGVSSQEQHKKLSSMRTYNPFVKIIHWGSGSLEVEARLHKKFKDKHVTGEWFNLTQDDIDWIITNYPIVEHPLIPYKNDEFRPVKYKKRGNSFGIYY